VEPDAGPPQAIQSLPHRTGSGKHAQVGIEVHERDQNERPIGDPGMRKCESLGPDLQVLVEKKVEVNNPRPPPLGALASHRALDRETGGKEFLRPERCGDLGARVQERRLIGETDGVGLVAG